jgi:hypothetical protein
LDNGLIIIVFVILPIINEVSSGELFFQIQMVVCQGLCKSSASGSLAVTEILLSLTLRITA